ncbi:aromatic acid exporter family protein [Streptomyces sp. NPDC059517]|uniref:FUSC family protein n=1 Tax=Streptomyces sp. NPDC059517 TaxID=3346855 RepID=UPI00368FDC92
MWNALTREAAAVGRSVRTCFAESGPERDTAVQSLKAAGAALLAWALAGWWWNAPMALLAPWTALFLVQSTVYRSLLTALQQVVVVVTGTLLATGALALTHDTMAAMALALPLTVLLGTYARLGSQGLYAPTAALFVLAYGSYSGFDILHRLLETLLGAAIGIAVNASVLPPVHSGRVHHLRARLPRDCAHLLHEVADGIETSYDKERARGWYDSAVRLADVVTELRTARRWSDESHRFNPGRRLRRSAAAPPPVEWDFTWTGSPSTSGRSRVRCPRRSRPRSPHSAYRASCRRSCGRPVTSSTAGTARRPASRTGPMRRSGQPWRPTAGWPRSSRTAVRGPRPRSAV